MGKIILNGEEYGSTSGGSGYNHIWENVHEVEIELLNPVSDGNMEPFAITNILKSTLYAEDDTVIVTGYCMWQAYDSNGNAIGNRCIVNADFYNDVDAQDRPVLVVDGFCLNMTGSTVAKIDLRISYVTFNTI